MPSAQTPPGSSAARQTNSVRQVFERIGIHETRESDGNETTTSLTDPHPTIAQLSAAKDSACAIPEFGSMARGQRSNVGYWGDRMAAATASSPTAVDAFNRPTMQGDFGKGCLGGRVTSRRDIFKSRTGRLPRLEAAERRQSRAERFDGLLARCAGVHVDFHAHRHFDDFWSLPSHSGSSQLIWHDVRTGAEPRAAPNAAQVRNIGA